MVSTWGEPDFSNSDAMQGPAQMTLVADFAMARGIRHFDNQAALEAATGMAEDYYAIVKSIPGALWRYSGANPWTMLGTPVFASTADRDNSLTLPVAGMLVKTADTGTTWLYTGGAWTRFNVPPTAFTPALTAATTSPTLGSAGAAVGRYAVAAGICTFTLKFIFGGAGITSGTGNYLASLPLAALGTTNLDTVVSGYYDKAGSSKLPAAGLIVAGASTISPIRLNDGTGVQLSSTQAMGSAGSFLVLSGSYPVA